MTSETPDWVKEIERKNLGKPVLLVEGSDDIPVFRHFLNQHAPDWELRFFLAEAGGKRRVIQGVSTHRPHWLGIIDRDEWSEEEVRTSLEKSAHLRALPRFCIESYFCVPEEIWMTLPEPQKARFNHDIHQLGQPVLGKLPEWVAHGALWRVLQNFKSSSGLPHELENRPVRDINEIRRILEQWHNQLAPETIIRGYEQKLNDANILPQMEQLIQYIHGKKFFAQVVVQTLGQKLSGQGKGDWIQKFFDANMQPPQDMKDLLNWVISNL
jgi:hypothetical protein